MEDRNGPAAFFREKGLDLGTEVCRKADPHVVYVVKKMYRRTEGDKEAVLDLAPHIGGDGSQQTALAVTWTAFTEGWLHASAAALGEVVAAEGWPQSAAPSKPEVLCGGGDARFHPPGRARSVRRFGGDRSARASLSKGATAREP